MDTSEIRDACLQAATSPTWQQPSGDEVRVVIRRAGLSGSQVAQVLGLADKGGDRTVRRWISGDPPIPYAAWALLCELAGLGTIWRSSGAPPRPNRE